MPLLQEQVGEYTTDVYDITDLILISRKRYVQYELTNSCTVQAGFQTNLLLTCFLACRRENLSPEKIKELEHLQKKLETGVLDEKDFVVHTHTFKHTHMCIHVAL